MPASESRIAANRANALKSTGPRIEEGKLASRAKALKHGLTARVVLPQGEADEGRVASRGGAGLLSVAPPRFRVSKQGAAPRPG